MQLSEILIERGVLDDIGLQRAEKAQRELGGDLREILLKLGIVSGEDLAAALAQQHGLPLVGKREYPATPLYLSKVSVSFLKASKILPLRETDDGLELAMVNPGDDYARQAMTMLTGRPVQPMVGVAKELEAALEQLYGDGRSSLDRIIDDAGQGAGGDSEEDIERLKDLASEAPIVRLVNNLFLRAYEEQIERLEEEKKGIADDIRDVYAEAKAVGYDAKIMRQIVRLRKMDANDRAEMEMVLDTYKAALGLG